MGAAREPTQMENSYTALLRVTHPLRDRDMLLPPRPTTTHTGRGWAACRAVFANPSPLYILLTAHPVTCSVSLVTRAEGDGESRKAPHIYLRISSFECLLRVRQRSGCWVPRRTKQRPRPLEHSGKREARHGCAPERRAGGSGPTACSLCLQA